MEGTRQVANPDAIGQAAAEMAAALAQESPEVQQAYRYLFARVALDAGILELIGHEIRPSGERLVCREITTGKFYTVDRPVDWTEAEERASVTEMRRRLSPDQHHREG